MAKSIYPCLWFDGKAKEGELFQDPERAPRVGEALLKMNKLDIETLKNA